MSASSKHPSLHIGVITSHWDTKTPKCVPFRWGWLLFWPTERRLCKLGWVWMGNVSETPTPTTCLKSTAVHLQFVRQYAPHLYCHTLLASKLPRKGNPAVRLPFVLQYASHLYGSTPPICTAVLLEKYWGLGSPERFWMELTEDVPGVLSQKITSSSLSLQVWNSQTVPN